MKRAQCNKFLSLPSLDHSTSALVKPMLRKTKGAQAWPCPCAQGFYVLVDFHAAPGDTTVSSGNFVSDWQTLWRAITALPTFASDLAGRIFLDLYNEPDGIGLRQENAKHRNGFRIYRAFAGSWCGSQCNPVQGDGHQ